MASGKPPGRGPSFQDLDQMVAYADRLLEGGYVMRGKWTLGQACSHLAEWMRFPMEGFPRAPLPVRMVMFLMRVTVGGRMRRKILAQGFKPGMPTAPATVPAADSVSDRQGVETLRAMAARAAAFDGPLHPSPLFGAMDKPTWIRATLLHAEHHLGFLEPR